MTIYKLKQWFQTLLRPLTAHLAGAGITANQVTIFTSLVSVLVGAAASVFSDFRFLFVIISLWLPIRLALNAIDGILAREHDQESLAGAYLNELGDIVSDTALYFPFSFVAPFTPLTIGLIIFLSALSEFTGVLGKSVGASRRYDGPMGKSDRAFVFGILGLVVGSGITLPNWFAWLVPLLVVALCLTIVNRIREGINECSGN